MTTLPVDFPRLAEILAERVRPVLPVGLVVEVADPAYLSSLRPHPAWVGFDTTPADGVLRVWSPPDPSTRIVQMRHDRSPVATELAISGVVGSALRDIADEASMLSRDHYDGDAEVEAADLRIWFGRAPSAPAGTDWRSGIPELPPIPLADITR